MILITSPPRLMVNLSVERLETTDCIRRCVGPLFSGSIQHALLIFMGVQLIYKMESVTAVQQRDSVTHTHIVLLSNVLSHHAITGYGTQSPVLHGRAGDGCEESGPVFFLKRIQSNWLDGFFTVRPRLNFGARIRLR